MIALDPLNTPAGLVQRLLLHETRSPAYGARYDRDESLKAMRLMRQVVLNRLKQPRLWGAPDARDEIGIITVTSQFGQFGLYPDLPPAFMAHVEELVASANDAASHRHAENLQHVADAIAVATEAACPAEITDLAAVSWRTEGHGSPGRRFRALVTVQGNTFFALGG